MSNTIKVASVVFFVGALVAFGLALSLRGAGVEVGKDEGYAPVQMEVDPIQPSGKVVASDTGGGQGMAEVEGETAAMAQAEGDTPAVTAAETAPMTEAENTPEPPMDEAAAAADQVTDQATDSAMAAEPVAEPVQPAAGQEAPAAPAPAQAEEPAEQPEPLAKGRVESVRVTTSGTAFTLTVTCSAAPGEIRGFYLKDRNKYVIDMMGDWSLDKKNVIRVPDGFVRHVVVGEHPGSYIRMAVQLEQVPSGPATPPVVKAKGNSVAVTVTFP